MQIEQTVTDRLRFRHLTLSDKQPLLDYITNSESGKHLIGFEDPNEYLEAWLYQQFRRYEMPNHGLFALETKDAGRFIGHSGLVRQFVDGIPKWEVSFMLFQEFRGQGYATEAVKACRDICFKEEMAETLISIIHPDDIKSKEVAERNNMTWWKNTQFKSKQVEVFRIRREDWERSGMSSS